MIEQSNLRRLSNAQSLLLQLFERDLPEEDLLEVRNMLTTYFFKKAEEAANLSMQQKGKTIKQLNQEIEQLNQDSRTERLNRMKA